MLVQEIGTTSHSLHGEQKLVSRSFFFFFLPPFHQSNVRMVAHLCVCFRDCVLVDSVCSCVCVLLCVYVFIFSFPFLFLLYCKSSHRCRRVGSSTRRKDSSPGRWILAGRPTGHTTRTLPPGCPTSPACCDARVSVAGYRTSKGLCSDKK